MYKLLSLIACLLFVGGGCAQIPADENTQQIENHFSISESVQVPTQGYFDRLTYRRFGEYFKERFVGHHVAEDVEYVDVAEEVPVFAMADGVVEYVDWVSGYGGVMRLEHQIEGEVISAIYGHIDLGSVQVEQGDPVEKGQVLASLGEGETQETDGERKHLHFALWEGSDDRINGYVPAARDLDTWINPATFFTQHGVTPQKTEKKLSSLAIPEAEDRFRFDLKLPAGWDVEYVPSIEALNLYVVEGAGSARERSQVFIRFFDAEQFLTLSTVTIHGTEDLTVGQDDYTARRYDIEKKPGVANFPDQPDWRNQRHIVTDVREQEGFSRFYVIAKNPELDMGVYEKILASLKFE